MKGIIELKVFEQRDPEIKVSIGSHIKPQEFFKNRAGLWVSSEFTERILGVAGEGSQKDYLIESLDLVTSTSDENIEKSLGKKNIFSETDVCAIVASLIEKQSDGKEGTLLADGKANLFYTPECVVRVRWSSYDRCWGVDAWARDGDGWARGYRVFSPQLTLDI